MNCVHFVIAILLFTSNSFALPFGPRVELARVNDTKLNEISGIASGINNKGILWIHDDSGNESILYGINKQAQIKYQITLRNTNFYDAEDIAIGPGPEPEKNYIYLADIGDNNAVRQKLNIYRFEEPILLETDTIISLIIDDFDVLTYSYPDGPRDAETIMIDPIDKEIIIISKRETNVNVYSAAIPDKGNHVLDFKNIAVLPYGNEGFASSGVVAGDISRKGNELLIKTYGRIFWYKREANQTLADAFQTEPVILDYTPEPQGEAICFDADDSGFYTISEAGPFNVTPRLYLYPRITSDIDNGFNNLLDIKNEEFWLSKPIIFNMKGIPVVDNESYYDLNAGLYFVTYLLGDSLLTKKMLLIK